jgi:thiol-disulfide isomerase/thioredoxin
MRFALLLLAIGLLLGACGNEVEKKPTSVKIGDTLPAIQLLSISGEVADSEPLFKDKVVILNLWATWCPPCRKEMPDLVRLSELLPKDKFLVIGLSIDNNLGDVQKYMSEIDIPFPMFWDTGGRKIASPIFKAFKYPQTFVFNRKGVLVEKVLGIFPWASPEAIAMLEEIQRTGKALKPAKNKAASMKGSLKPQPSS